MQMRTAKRLLKCLLALLNKKLFLYQKNIEKSIEKRQKLCAKINLFFGKTILAQFFRRVFVDLSGILAIKNSDFRREWRKSPSSIPFTFWKGETCARIKKIREKKIAKLTRHKWLTFTSKQDGQPQSLPVPLSRVNYKYEQQACNFNALNKALHNPKKKGGKKNKNAKRNNETQTKNTCIAIYREMHTRITNTTLLRIS